MFTGIEHLLLWRELGKLFVFGNFAHTYLCRVSMRDSWQQGGSTAELVICILHMVVKKLSLSGVHQSVVSYGDFLTKPYGQFCSHKYKICIRRVVAFYCTSTG